MIQGMEIQGIASAVSNAINARLKETTGVAVSFAVMPTSGRRSVDLNALIARVQAGMTRNPFYIKKASDQWTAIRFLAGGLFSEDGATRTQAANQIARFMLEAIGMNVTAQRNASGSSFKSLSPNYAAYKRRKFGFVTPILRASGELLDGLRTQITGLR